MPRTHLAYPPGALRIYASLWMLVNNLYSFTTEAALANIKLVQEREASGKVKEIYEDIKATMGWSFVPETFQMIAHDPEHLEPYWAHYKQVMGPGKLDLKTKKLIAYLVSVMNNCGV